MQSLEDIIIRFDIDPSHSLKQQNKELHEQGKTRYETRWYIEKDQQHRTIARYRSWSNQATEAPFRTQIGWERYSPEGALLDREVRYAKQDGNTTLH